MRGKRPVRVVLYDEHLMCLESIAAALDEERVLVVATTVNRDELCGIVESRRPDVCIVDVAAPDDDCLAVIARIHLRVPDTRIVALVEELPAAFLHAALDAGIRGFARKDASLRALHHTIDRVAAGHSSVGAQMVLRAHAGAVTAPARSLSESHSNQLTEREQEVLDRMIAGEDTRHIAASLHISRSTARSHVQNVRLKLGAHTRLQAVAFALGSPGRPPRLNGRSVIG